jgi:hypothetical protein
MWGMPNLSCGSVRQLTKHSLYLLKLKTGLMFANMDGYKFKKNTGLKTTDSWLAN